LCFGATFSYFYLFGRKRKDKEVPEGSHVRKGNGVGGVRRKVIAPV